MSKAYVGPGNFYKVFRTIAMYTNIHLNVHTMRFLSLQEEIKWERVSEIVHIGFNELILTGCKRETVYVSRTYYIALQAFVT